MAIIIFKVIKMVSSFKKGIKAEEKKRLLGSGVARAKLVILSEVNRNILNKGFRFKFASRRLSRVAETKAFFQLEFLEPTPIYKAASKSNDPLLPLNIKISDKVLIDINDLLDDSINLISISKVGLSFEMFLSIVEKSPFSIKEWGGFLRLSLKKLLSIQKDNKVFNQAQSEIILQIAQLQTLGENVLGNPNNYAIWISSPSLVFDGKSPKEFLESTFGIQMLAIELHRIEYGILA